LAKQFQSQAGTASNAPAQPPGGGPAMGFGVQPGQSEFDVRRGGGGFGGSGVVTRGQVGGQQPLPSRVATDSKGDDGRSMLAQTQQTATLGEIVQNVDASGVVAGAVEQGALAGWARAGGLSLEIDLPESGQKLTFSKVGGDPILTLGLRPKRSLEAGFGLAWFVVWVALALGVVNLLRRGGGFARLWPHAPIVLVAAGLVWFVLLPVAAIGFILFAIGAVAYGWQHRRATA
jgi:hypothetical protein